MSLRRYDGFRRYALSIQYHGGSFLGFTDQGFQEDCLLPDGTDLRGFRSVESRVKEALGKLFGYDESFENVQVSSRTDRGVHALKNTFHVDVRRKTSDNNDDTILRLQRGLNYHLTRQTNNWWQKLENENALNKDNVEDNNSKKRRLQSYNILGREQRQRKHNNKNTYSIIGGDWRRHSLTDELRILSAKKAPDTMLNPYHYDGDPTQPPEVDWNARFSATERTYVYRLLWYSERDNEFGIPFEWDRSWRIRSTNTHTQATNQIKQQPIINIAAMDQAARILEGTHDFTSFRAAKCQRSSPVTTIKSIKIGVQPYQGIILPSTPELFASALSPQLVTIQVVGNAFLYRQVRNMVGMFVEVGQNKLQPSEVQDILEAKDRSIAPNMAPPHGLFLVDVKHGDFEL